MTESKYKLVPVEHLYAALNYILHAGSSFTLRGEPHPQQQIVDWMQKATFSEVSPWVSVDERLPKTDGFYMCAHKPDRYGNSLWVERGFSRCFDPDVTHWWDESILPIPRPKK